MPEIQHYTLEQVGEHLDETLSLLAEREIPAELLPKAFELVFQRLSEKSIVQYQPASVSLGGLIQ